MLQLLVAVSLERTYEPTVWRAFLLAAPYPLVYWLISATAALRSQIMALLRGPSRERVVWDIPREGLESAPAATGEPDPHERPSPTPGCP